LHHKGGELVGQNFMVGQILKKLVEDKGEALHHGWKKAFETF
jgi:hypothetical protein